MASPPSELIKLGFSPFKNSVASPLGLPLMLGMPSDEKSVTIQIMPNITDFNYSEEGPVESSDWFVNYGSAEFIPRYKFDLNFEEKNECIAEMEEGTFAFKLMNVIPSKDIPEMYDYEIWVVQLPSERKEP